MTTLRRCFSVWSSARSCAPSPSAPGTPPELVRARSATGLPCFQHVLEMLRVADYEAVLIDCDLHAGEIAERAAERGADLIVSGERLDAASLASVARAATRHSVALVVLRPALHDRGYTFVSELIAADPGWQPSFVNLELSGDRPAEALLRDAVAAMTRLLPQTPFELSAAIAGPADAPEAMAAQIRLPGGALASLTARVAPVTKLSLVATSPAGSTELSSEGGAALVTLTAPGRHARALSPGDRRPARPGGGARRRRATWGGARRAARPARGGYAGGDRSRAGLRRRAARARPHAPRLVAPYSRAAAIASMRRQGGSRSSAGSAGRGLPARRAGRMIAR